MGEMTCPQRILAALAIQEPDRVLIYELIFSLDIYEGGLGHRPGYFNPDDSVNCSAALGMDGPCAVYAGYLGIEGEGSVGGAGKANGAAPMTQWKQVGALACRCLD